MSVENLKEYTRRCMAEPELRARAQELGMADMEGHMQEASNLGLDWTRDDLVAFRKEVVDAEGEIEDLSQEELEKVAGGVVTTTGAVVAAVAIGVSAVVAGGFAAGFGAATASSSAGGTW